MLSFLIENIGTILIGAILAFIVILIILKMRKDKKAGKSSCGCNCGCCANEGLCHGKKDHHKS
jgi:hypothetical protein